MALDINSVLPTTINVRFPYQNAPKVPSYYLSAIEITQKGLQLNADGLFGNDWNMILHDSYVALYDQKTGDLFNPTNKGDLDALASQIATDFWNWRLSNQDTLYNGIVALEPTGFDFLIEFSYTGDDATTRTFGNPMNGEPEEYQHSATSPGGCSTQSQAAWGTTTQVIPAGGGGAPSCVTMTLHLGGATDGSTDISATVCNPYPFSIPNGTIITAVRWNCNWLIVGIACPSS